MYFYIDLNKVFLSVSVEVLLGLYCRVIQSQSFSLLRFQVRQTFCRSAVKVFQVFMYDSVLELTLNLVTLKVTLKLIGHHSSLFLHSQCHLAALHSLEGVLIEAGI